jgi:hypothetical protein
VRRLIVVHQQFPFAGGSRLFTRSLLNAKIAPVGIERGREEL